MAEALLQIEVVWALPQQQWLWRLEVPVGASALDAVRLSGLAAQCPDLDLDALLLGVYGQRVATDTLLRDGDRVEIYRPLALDPMRARRQRARQRPRKR